MTVEEQFTLYYTHEFVIGENFEEGLFLLILLKRMTMRTLANNKTPIKKTINWAFPDQTVTHDEFLNSIREAEKGSFMTIDEFEQQFEQWKLKKGL